MPVATVDVGSDPHYISRGRRRPSLREAYSGALQPKAHSDGLKHILGWRVLFCYLKYLDFVAFYDLRMNSRESAYGALQWPA
jgi:hypothetical protein